VKWKLEKLSGAKLFAAWLLATTQKPTKELEAANTPANL
jgi:hypothetical protein